MDPSTLEIALLPVMNDSVTQNNVASLAPDEVASHSQQCWLTFSRALSVLPDKLETFKCKLTVLDLRTIFEQFQIWAKNVGVFAKNQGSLDDRLKEASAVKDTVISHLKGIQSNLQHCLVLEPHNCQDEDDESYESSGSSEISQVSDQGRDDGGISAARYELDARLEDVLDLIDKLSAIALAIRKSGLRTKALRAAAYEHWEGDVNKTQLFETDYLPRLLDSRFGIKNYLKERLSRAISMRRRYFDYQKAHQQKLAYTNRLPTIPEPTAQSSVSMASIKLSSKALEPGTFMAGSNRIVLSSHVGSLPSTRHSDLRVDMPLPPESSIGRGSQKSSNSVLDTKTLPPPPEISRLGKYTQCPYCCLLLPKEKLQGEKWTNHIIRDLRPFVCLAEECDNVDPGFDDEDSWYDHHRKKHALQWWCEGDINHEPHSFSSGTDFKQHLLQLNESEYTERDLATLLKLAARPSGDPFSFCPFCTFPKGETGVEAASPTVMRRYVVNHLQACFLYALPARNDVVDVESSRAKYERSTVMDLLETNIRVGELENQEFHLNEDLDLPDTSSEVWAAVQESVRVQGKAHDSLEDDPILVSFIARAFNQVGWSSLPSYISQHIDRPLLRDAIRLEFQDDPDTNASTSKVVVVHGPGGVGKTHVALNYVQAFRHDYNGVFWINCASNLVLERESRQLHSMLHNLSYSPEQGQLPFGDVVSAIHHWFSVTQGKWLLILDSADDQRTMVRSLMPSMSGVQILITTRDSSLSKLGAVVQVGTLEQEQALSLFWKAAKLDDTKVSRANRNVALEIVAELDHLPLALISAGALLSTSPVMVDDLTKFLSLYLTTRKELLVGPSEVGAVRSPVATIWEASFRLMEHRSQIAAKLLPFLSMLDEKDIPLSLFDVAVRAETESQSSENIVEEQENLSTRHKQWHWKRSILGTSTNGLSNIEAAAEILKDYAFVNTGSESGHLRMHRLVQDWIFARLDKSSRVATCMSVVDFIATLLPVYDPVEAHRIRLDLHVARSFEVAAGMVRHMSDVEWPSLVTLLDSYADFTDKIGAWMDSERIKYFQFIKLSNNFGKSNPKAISSANNFARTLIQQGKLDQARLIQEEALGEARMVFGEDHENTLTAMNTLAIILEEQGKFAEARIIMGDVFTKRQTLLGLENPDTLSTQGNFAMMLRSEGDLDGALMFQEEVVARRKKILGDEHPETLTALNNLAITHQDLGNFDEAETVLIDVLEKRKQVLGARHPDTITSMNNLAWSVFYKKRHAESLALQRQAIKDMEQALGPDHPKTITLQYTMGIMCLSLEKFTEAKELMKEIFEKRKRVLGNSHRSTLQAMNALGDAYRGAGDAELAVEMHRGALRSLQQLFGEDSPRVIEAQENLEKSLEEQNRLDKIAADETIAASFKARNKDRLRVTFGKPSSTDNAKINQIAELNTSNFSF